MANGQLTAESCPGARLLPFAEGSGPSGYSECGGATPDGEGSWLNQLNPF